MSLDGMNSVFLFNKYEKYIIVIFGFCPKNLAFARKVMVFAQLRGLQPPQIPWLVRLWY